MRLNSTGKLMKNNTVTIKQECLDPNNQNQTSVEINIDSIESDVLRRILDEIKNENSSTVYNYDRIHNRHNRS